MTGTLVRWSVTLAVLVTVTIAAFVPILFGLAETPLHDGSELPGSLLLIASGVASAGVGALAARVVHGRLRRTRAAGDPTRAA